MMLNAVVEVFRSYHKADCAERAFMLMAVGIPNHVHYDGWHYVLTVEETQLEAALSHLSRYAAESRPPPPPPPPTPLYSHAIVGCLLYALVLLGVGYAIAGGVFRLDAFDIGAIDSTRVKAGEWWRAWTALTLHVDAAHVAANLGGGVWFGYLASRQIGPGTAWLLT